MIKKNITVFMGIFLMTACGSDSSSKPDTLDNSQQSETNKQPDLYPFGLEVKDVKVVAKRSNCGGDCCSDYELKEIDEKSIYSIRTDCGDYGSNATLYYFEGKELVAMHISKSDAINLNNGKTIRSETTINFRDKYTFSRSDTVPNGTEGWMKSDFQEVAFKDNSKEYLKEIQDLKKPISYQSKKDFTIYSQEKAPGSKRNIYFLDEERDFEVKITSGSNYTPIKDYSSNGIPKEAIFAFSTWFAGGGETVYGKLENGVVKIYRRFDEETLEEQPFNLLMVVDPNTLTELPDYYIVYKDDKLKSKNLMVAFNKSGKALYVKYDGQDRKIALGEGVDKSRGANIKYSYPEIIHGIKFGNYTMSHEGNWDFVKYIAKDGEEFNFTILYDQSLIEGEYRSTPAF